MKKILIVGQGIAGTMLAWMLKRSGALVHIAEGDYPDSATRTAAGIINPVTGKRYVKSWLLDTLLPVAKRVYQEMEVEFGVKLWHERPILRVLNSVEEANDWSARAVSPEYADFVSEREGAGDWEPLLKDGFRFGVLRQSAQVDLEAIQSAFRQQAQNEGIFIAEKIGYQSVKTLSAQYDFVVFCEGHRGKENPFFPDLPWQLAKGEALIIRFNDQRANSIQEMLKKNMILSPLGDGLFWAGATYRWSYENADPSAEKAFILENLAPLLKVPFEIVDHKAAIRPTVKDRRPFLGQSKIANQICIFNGLGTKGTLLAPYFAERLSDFLIHGIPIPVEVDIRRFDK